MELWLRRANERCVAFNIAFAGEAYPGLRHDFQRRSPANLLVALVVLKFDMWRI
jgi:hypothetical protein